MTSAGLGPTHTLTLRVYYEDTDAVGVVYYANYLKFFERGRTEWLRAQGLDQRELAACEHALFVVRRTDIRYRQPARLDDLLTVRTRLDSQRASSLVFFQQAWRDDLLLVEGTAEICTVHAHDLRPMRMPPSLRNLLDKVSS